MALLQLDIDNFKLVNDSLGHRAGDELICRLAARLQESIRATDLLARTGGDGFLLLLSDLHDDAAAVAERVAAQIVGCLAEPFMVAGAEFQVSASIGIALAPRDASDAEALLAHADSAMYQAKEVARGGWAAYAQAGRDPLERLSMAARLRRALSRRGVPAALPADLRHRFGRAGRASRRCCAGTTPSAASWCRRASSSRSPRRRG